MTPLTNWLINCTLFPLVINAYFKTFGSRGSCKASPPCNRSLKEVDHDARKAQAIRPQEIPFD